MQVQIPVVVAVAAPIIIAIIMEVMVVQVS